MPYERYNDVEKIPVACFRCNSLVGATRGGKIIYRCKKGDFSLQCKEKNGFAPAQEGDKNEKI